MWIYVMSSQIDFAAQARGRVERRLRSKPNSCLLTPAWGAKRVIFAFVFFLPVGLDGDLDLLGLSLFVSSRSDKGEEI